MDTKTKRNIHTKNPRYRPSIYPNLEKVALAKFGTLKNFTKAMGVAKTDRWMHGINDPSKYAIDQALKLTGLTYEIAFSRELKL